MSSPFDETTSPFIPFKRWWSPVGMHIAPTALPWVHTKPRNHKRCRPPAWADRLSGCRSRVLWSHPAGSQISRRSRKVTVLLKEAPCGTSSRTVLFRGDPNPMPDYAARRISANATRLSFAFHKWPLGQRVHLLRFLGACRSYFAPIRTIPTNPLTSGSISPAGRDLSRGWFWWRRGAPPPGPEHLPAVVINGQSFVWCAG